MTENTGSHPQIHHQRLFFASCLALIATSVAFGVVGASMGALKQEFILSNEQVGWIGGAALWGFSITIVILGPLVDLTGMKNQLRFAFLCHLLGVLLMIFANGFLMLFIGALILAFGNGTVEAACNPLVATIYPKEKTKKLNQFHVWFPGGIVIGAVLSFFLDEIAKGSGVAAIGDWRIKIGLILIPTIIYGYLINGETFPQTERKASGLSYMDMVKGAFARPLFWILFLCMAVTASLELGPGRWIPAVLEAGGIAGILVLAYINGLMAVLRFYAGPFVKRFSPTGLLVGGAILTGIGLYWFSFAETTLMAFLSATVFAVGVCYFWPTMLGVTAERIPKSGALGLALMGGMGMMAVGAFTAPMIGKLADNYLHDKLVADYETDTIAILDEIQETYPGLIEDFSEDVREVRRPEVMAAVSRAQAVALTVEETETLPEIETANALRAALDNAPPGTDELKEKIGVILGKTDNYGGRRAFRYIAPFSLIIIVVFGVLYIRDQRAGGYQAEKLTNEEKPENP